MYQMLLYIIETNKFGIYFHIDNIIAISFIHIPIYLGFSIWIDENLSMQRWNTNEITIIALWALWGINCTIKQK